MTAPLRNLIDELTTVATKEAFQPAAFAPRAVECLRRSKVRLSDVRDCISAWDTQSCSPHPVDTDEAPFLIDLHTTADWCLRCTLWPPVASTRWRDVVHDHFGFIAVKSLTSIAYYESVFRSFDAIPDGSPPEPFLMDTLHLLRPETIHAVTLPNDSFGATLAVRTRSVRETTYEWDTSLRSKILRTKSATDRKAAVLNIITQISN